MQRDQCDRGGRRGGVAGKLRADPGRRFLFRLAELTGRTVREVETTMTAHEVAEWQAELLLRHDDEARWQAERDMARKTTDAMAQPRTAPMPQRPTSPE